MYTKVTLSALLLFVTGLGHAQSIRAKVRSSSAKEAISYGTVEAYDREGNMVKSVLTDADGAYDMKFADTGTYTIKIKYAGFEATEEEVTVTDDIEKDFTVKRDESKKSRTLPSSSYTYRPRTDNIYYTNKVLEEKLEGLTAGEINDFAKWELWEDLTKNELSIYQKAWQLNPSNRYVVQAINQERGPLAGAVVKLFSSSGVLLWETITDNTGKAELWGSLLLDEGQGDQIEVIYQDESKKINRPKSFKRGINTVHLGVPCEVDNSADIAFVIDATGSMADEINFIKRDLNKVVYQAKENFSDVNIRFASVFYRDYTDDYVTKHKDFTNVLSEALVYIDDQGAAGGGDSPEAVDDALELAVNKLSWNSSARAKIIFLLLDAPAHNEPKNIEKLQKITREAAKKGIKIIPVTGSGLNKSGEYLMRALALGTNGKYVFLTNHSGIGHKHIAPSTDEYDVELLLNRMSTIITNNLYYPSCEEAEDSSNFQQMDSIVSYTDSSTQIDNQPKEIKWNFYPNPTRGIVNIEVSETIEFIYLTDLSGKILQKIPFEGSKRKQISLDNYPTGVYLLRYPIGKQWISGRLVLTR